MADKLLKLAVAAHAGTSFSPEKRGAQEVADYEAHLAWVRERLEKYATTDEAREILEEEMERYTAGYRKHFTAYLGAKGRTLSWMITGPANFPTRRNEKAMDSERRRWEEMKKWQERAFNSIRRRLTQATAGDPLEEMRKKLATAEQVQELMKAANKIIRRKKLTAEEKIAAMKEAGLSETAARAALEPDCFGGLGFASFQLTNNNANIRRMKERLAELEARAGRETTEEEVAEGVVIVENAEDDRLQIFFDGKPEAAVRDALKARGFRWAPSVGAWQRQLTRAAILDARQILNSEEG